MAFVNPICLSTLFVGFVFASGVSAWGQDLFAANYKPAQIYEGIESNPRNEAILSIGLLKHPLEDLTFQEEMDSPVALEDDVMEASEREKANMIKKALARSYVAPVNDIRIMRRGVNPLRIMKRSNVDTIRIMKKNPSVGTLRIMKRAANLGAVRIMKKNVLNEADN